MLRGHAYHRAADVERFSQRRLGRSKLPGEYSPRNYAIDQDGYDDVGEPSGPAGRESLVQAEASRGRRYESGYRTVLTLHIRTLAN